MTTGGELHVTALTHRGAVRTSNEDALVMGALAVCVDTSGPVRVLLPTGEPVILAVADGIGGHAAGEIASEHVAQRLGENSNQFRHPDQLSDLLLTLNEELQEHAARFSEFSGMGTTVAGLLLHDGRAWWFNVGDSRTYRLTGDRLVQLTEDDSLPTGAPTNFITQSLGGTSKGAITPHVGEDPGGPTGAWLLCTDGLTDLVDVPDMEKILATHTNDEAAVHALWQAAMAAGGKDNISIVLARA